jgi:hypothetical protein
MGLKPIVWFGIIREGLSMGLPGFGTPGMIVNPELLTEPA